MVFIIAMIIIYMYILLMYKKYNWYSWIKLNFDLINQSSHWIMGYIVFWFNSRLLQGHKVADSNNDGGPQFAEVFVVVWVGSFVITINSKLLGGQM